MISPLEGSTSSVGYSRWHFFAQPLLLLFAKTRQSRNKNSKCIYISCHLGKWTILRFILLHCALEFPCHTFERCIYYNSASLFDAWPPSTLLMAPFCCAAPIIQGVPPDFKYQNEQQITQPTKSFTLKIS